MRLEVPEGVQAFNLWTLTIMARLWEEFPGPQYFYNSYTTVFVTSDHTVEGKAIGPQGPQQLRFFGDTLRWLMAEGFARGTAQAPGNFAAVTLSRRGFSILDEVPRSIEPKVQTAPEKKLGELYKEAAVTQGAVTIAGLVKLLLLPSGQNGGTS
jgi:hypothetical protein